MWQAAELKRSLQALAQPAEVQLSLFPEFVLIGDELAMDFGEAYDRYRESAEVLSDLQAGAIDALQAELDRLSRSQPKEFWYEVTILRDSPQWARVRELAHGVLVSFGWPDEIPAKSGATYVAATKAAKSE